MGHLDGPIAKIGRAQAHIDALQERLKAFRDAEPYTFRFDSNREGTEHILRSYINHLPPEDLGLIVGDFAHNARSALDLLVHEITATLPSDPHWRKIAFPIFKDLGQRSAPKQKGWGYLGKEDEYLFGIGATERGHIQWFQPYHRGAGYVDDPLWLLHELNNCDKHRVIQVVGVFDKVGGFVLGEGMIGRNSWTFTGSGTVALLNRDSGESISSFRTLNDGVIAENGGPVAEARFKFPTRVQMQPKVTTKVQFGPGEIGIEGRPVVDTLTAILDRVKEVVRKF